MYLLWFNFMILYLFIEYEARLENIIREVTAKHTSKRTSCSPPVINDVISEKRSSETFGTNTEVTDLQEENKLLLEEIADLQGKVSDLETGNAQLENMYSDILQRLESEDTEIIELRTEFTILRNEMEGLISEYNILEIENVSLKLELNNYLKLLGFEEIKKSSYNTISQ